MDSTLVTVAQVALAAVAIGIGTVKLVRPYDSLRRQFFWLEDLTPEMVRGIGVAEILSGLALILPAVLEITYWLAVVAAAGYAALMLVVAALHTSARRPLIAIPRALLIAVSLVVVVGLV